MMSFPALEALGKMANRRQLNTVATQYKFQIRLVLLFNSLTQILRHFLHQKLRETWLVEGNRMMLPHSTRLKVRNSSLVYKAVAEERYHDASKLFKITGSSLVVELVSISIPLALTPEDDPWRDELRKFEERNEEIDGLTHEQFLDSKVVETTEEEIPAEKADVEERADEEKEEEEEEEEEEGQGNMGKSMFVSHDFMCHAFKVGC